ncbi:hypothetical protein KY363_05440 [Candidatus Woesearchaeota archaeon]|nr:hypothetical protein [Candidatus Woesearchaeota archaeon]
MAEKDVVITYETLFELLRIEKNREDLQKLDERFFDDVLKYLNDKKAKFDSKESQSVLFAADEKERARLELENIRKILKELYDKREKKIISTALNNARTGVAVVNTSSMLPSERMLFDAVSAVLSEFRTNILFRLAGCEQPNIDALSDKVISKLNGSIALREVEASRTVEVPDERGPGVEITGGYENPVAEEPVSAPSRIETRIADEQPKELKTTPNLSDSGANAKKIRFLASIGEIVGPDLQIYGPYEQGAVISLPRELARVLVEKRQAEEVSNG